MSLIDRIHNLIHQSESGQPLSPYSQVPIPSDVSPFQETYRVYPDTTLQNPNTTNFYFSPPKGKRWEILYISHLLFINNAGSYRRSYFGIVKKGTTGPPATTDFRGYFGISSPQCLAGDLFGKGAYINYIPGGEYQSLDADYERGVIFPYSDRTDDSNLKTITVPDYCLWDIDCISVFIKTSASVGARNFYVLVLRPLGDDFPIYSSPVATMAASQTAQILLEHGLPVSSTVFGGLNVATTGPLPVRRLPAGYRIKVYDASAFSGADDMYIEISRKESWGLLTGTIPKETVAIPKIFMSAKDTPDSELVVGMAGGTGNDSHRCYIGVKEYNE